MLQAGSCAQSSINQHVACRWVWLVWTYCSAVRHAVWCQFKPTCCIWQVPLTAEVTHACSSAVCSGSHMERSICTPKRQYETPTRYWVAMVIAASAGGAVTPEQLRSRFTCMSIQQLTRDNAVLLVLGPCILLYRAMIQRTCSIGQYGGSFSAQCGVPCTRFCCHSTVPVRFLRTQDVFLEVESVDRYCAVGPAG